MTLEEDSTIAQYSDFFRTLLF